MAKMDEERFKQLFFPFHAKLYRIAYSLIENSQDAEDIIQDTYCKLWEKRTELSQIQNPEAFCVTLVKNLCLDFLRSPRRRKENETAADNQLSALSESPETLAIRLDAVTQVEKVIDLLPENQRQVIRLRGINDCSMEEIEEITGLSAVNVRVLLSRARKMLRERFEKLSCYE